MTVRPPLRADSEGRLFPAGDLRVRGRAFAEAHQPRPQSPPPEDTGERLATLARRSNAGAETELRVSWAQFEGKPYLSLRQWEKHADGSWWPTKGKALSVRVAELGTFAEAVGAALDRAEAMPARGAR